MLVPVTLVSYVTAATTMAIYGYLWLLHSRVGDTEQEYVCSSNGFKGVHDGGRVLSLYQCTHSDT